MEQIKATTILCVKKNDEVSISGDGQVSFGDSILKSSAKKVRKVYKNQILAGFAGATADAITLFDKFESKLEEFKGNLRRSSVELAKEWRTDRVLRRLEAMMIVADRNEIFLISGSGSNLLEILKKNQNNEDFKIITIISNNKISTKIKSYLSKFYKDVLFIEHQRTLQKKIFYNTDVIFSVGYMKVIEKSIIENFDVINLHPSILPYYKGLMTQKRILINNEKYYGFTIHKVSTELDDGKTISNKTKKINTKNELKLLKKHKSLEHQFVYKQLVDYLLN